MNDRVEREGAERFEPAAGEPGEGIVSERGRFKPGQSGNPKGRPRKRVKAQSAVECALDELVTIKDSKGTRKISAAHAIAKRLVQKAMTGDIPALKVLMAQSPSCLTAVLEAGPGKKDYATFMQHLVRSMSMEAVNEFRDALVSWRQMRLGQTIPSD